MWMFIFFDVILTILYLILFIVWLMTMGLNVFGSIVTFSFVVIIASLIIWARN